MLPMGGMTESRLQIHLILPSPEKPDKMCLFPNICSYGNEVEGWTDYRMAGMKESRSIFHLVVARGDNVASRDSMSRWRVGT